MQNHLLEIRNLTIDAFNYASMIGHPTKELAELAFQAQVSLIAQELALRSHARPPVSRVPSAADTSSASGEHAY